MVCSLSGSASKCDCTFSVMALCADGGTARALGGSRVPNGPKRISVGGEGREVLPD